MFRKFNIKTLGVVFVILLVILLISRLFESKQGERTFKDELVNIDSTAMTNIGTILLYPQAENHAEIKFTLAGNNNWDVQKGNIKAKADSNSLKGLLGNILHLKSQQLASNDKNTWKDFSVNDSLGTRVKILNKDNEVMADVVVGRFSFNQQARSGSTYVRLYNEDEVYSVEGFLAMNCNQKFEQWRIKTIISGKYETWNKVTLQYPADSGFVLTKKDKKWMMDTAKCDSAKTAQYLSRLAYLNSTGFVDTFKNSVKQAAFTIKIEGSDQPITVQAYQGDKPSEYIINSSMNPDIYFTGSFGNVFETLFPSRAKLLPAAPVTPEKNVKKKK